MGVLLLCLALLTPAAAAAVEPDEPMEVDIAAADLPKGDKADGFAGGGGDELLLFEEMPVVVSASRQAQPLNWLSVPVSLVTAEDLHYSGLTTLPDILQFVPGMDVLKVDRQHSAVGVRGLHEVYSDRLLTLVDGRSADSALYGGPDFHALPILIEDIERIEVVRGPAGAAWGANAFTGAVNIITKDPKDTQGLLLSSTWNHVGDSYSHVRYGDTWGHWRYRVSVGYETMKTSEDAISDDNFASHDFARNWRLDSKAIYEPTERDKWSLGWAQSHLEYGNSNVAIWGKTGSWTEAGRGFGRYDCTVDDDTSYYVQWSGNFESVMASRSSKFSTAENALDGQFNFVPADGHRASVGGDVRWTHITNRNRNTPGRRNYVGAPYDEYWAGAFVIDRVQATDRLVVEAQFRGDWYSETQCDWSSRLTGLYSLDEDKHHVVRLSGAKAFRAPLAAIRKASGVFFPLPSPPFPPGLYGVNLPRPSQDLDNEETWCVEAGYTGKITSMLTARVDAYYQRFEKLISFERPADPLGMGRFFGVPANIDGADSYGAEAELALKNKDWKLSGWYAYNAFEPAWTQQRFRAYTPALHKAGITGRLFLPDDWTVNTNYRYTTTTSGHHLDAMRTIDVPATHRLDFALAKKVFQGKGEVLVGVSDVLNRTNDGALGADSRGGHDTAGRMFFLRFQWNF